MGVYPCVWGPHQWHMLHTIAIAYPDKPDEERKKSILGYLHSMCENLPCPGCSHHCSNYLQLNPPRVGSNESFFAYTVDFHNEVNTRLQKETWSYSRAREAYIAKISDQETLMNLSRADQIRREDFLTISKLKAKLGRLNLYYPLAIGIIVALALIGGAVVMAMWKRYKTKQVFNLKKQETTPMTDENN